MTETLLLLTISLFCGIKDSKIPEDKKIDCLEYMTNCSVGKAGKIKQEVVEECKVNYANQDN